MEAESNINLVEKEEKSNKYYFIKGKEVYIMAREKYITREVTFTEVTALYLNKQVLSNEEQKTILGGSFDNEMDILKELVLIKMVIGK